MEKCIFCKIVKEEIPSYKIYEDDFAIAILDAFPCVKGQALIIPKKHVSPSFLDLNEEDYTKLMLITKKIAKAIDKSVDCVKTGLMVEGLELNHVHIKVFPLSKIGFSEYPKTLDPKPRNEEMKDILEKIKKEL